MKGRISASQRRN